MATETIKRKGTKNRAIVNIDLANADEKSIWIFGWNANGILTMSLRVPIESVVMSARAKSDELSIGYYAYPVIASITAGTIRMTNVPIEIRNELIENAVGYNGIDENIGQSGFCEMTTCEIEGEE